MRLHVVVVTVLNFLINLGTVFSTPSKKPSAYKSEIACPARGDGRTDGPDGRTDGMGESSGDQATTVDPKGAGG